MLGYLIAGFVGFLIGVIISSILLAKKNLEAAQKIEDSVTNSVKQNFEAAKLVYQAAVAEYENGGAEPYEEETDGVYTEEEENEE